MRWTRGCRVSFNGYNRENNKDWTGFSGSVRAGGGYEADWGTIKAGPFAALDYAFSSRPSLTEDNGMGSRLHLDSETFHSLRSFVCSRFFYSTPFSAKDKSRQKIFCVDFMGRVDYYKVERTLFGTPEPPLDRGGGIAKQ